MGSLSEGSSTHHKTVFLNHTSCGVGYTASPRVFSVVGWMDVVEFVWHLDRLLYNLILVMILI